MSPDDYLRQRLEHHLAEIEGKDELIALVLPLLAMGARQSAAVWQGLREEVAQAVVLALKDDAERHWRIAWEGSLERANQILAVGEARGDFAIQALGTMAQADAIKLVTGRLEEAWELLDYAGRLYRMSHLPENEREIGWARTRIGRVYICAEVGKIEQGFAEAEQAREILEHEEVWQKVIALHLACARVLDLLQQFQESLAHYQGALDVAERLGQLGETYLPQIYGNMAFAQRWLGDWNTAISHYQWCIEWWEANQEHGAAALIRHNMAEAYLERGWYSTALRLLQEVEPILKEAYPQAWLVVVRNLIRCYVVLNRFRDSNFLMGKISSLAIDSHTDALQLYATILRSELNRRNGQDSFLDQTLERMAEGVQRLGTPEWQIELQLYQAEVALHRQQASLAAQIIESCISTDTLIRQRYLWSKANKILAKAILAEQDYKRAYIIGKTVWQAAHYEQNLTDRYQAHIVMGDAAFRDQRGWLARRHYQSAVIISRQLRERLSYGLSADGMASYQEGLHRLVRIELEAERVEAAFTTLESMKNHLFLAYLHQGTRLRWKQTAQTTPLIQEYHALRLELRKLKWHNQENLRDESKKISLETKVRQVVERLYLYSSETLPFWLKSPSLRDIQRYLDKDSALLFYYSDGQKIWLFVLTSGQLSVHSLNITHFELEVRLQKIQENHIATMMLYEPSHTATLIQTRKVCQLYQELGELLLAPIKPQLALKTHFYIVPYGILHTLPFNLLRVEHSYFIERCAITILPSAGFLAAPPNIARRGMRWVGYSCDGLLPHAVSEAATLHCKWGGDVFLENKASSRVLYKEPCQVLHFSTHGVHDVDEHFDRSYIELSDSEVYSDDLLQTDWSYELVTLSACETGVVKVAPGEDVMGLGRTFLQAGTGAVVSSLWRVREEITVPLMNYFYDSLFAGATKSDALRMAQRRLLDANPRLHPVFWGAFQLVGNPKPLVTHFER